MNISDWAACSSKLLNVQRESTCHQLLCCVFVLCHLLCFHAQVFVFFVLHVASLTSPWGQNVDTGWTYSSEGSMCKCNSNNNRFLLRQLYNSWVEQVIVSADLNKMTAPQRKREHYQPVHILSHHIPMFCHAPVGLQQTHKAPLGVCMKPPESLFNMFLNVIWSQFAQVYAPQVVGKV